MADAEPEPETESEPEPAARVPKARPPRVGPMVHLAELLEFVYPLGAEHPKVGPRLFLFALYGPLREGWLWGGPWNNKKRLEEWLKAGRGDEAQVTADGQERPATVKRPVPIRTASGGPAQDGNALPSISSGKSSRPSTPVSVTMSGSSLKRRENRRAR